MLGTILVLGTITGLRGNGNYLDSLIQEMPRVSSDPICFLNPCVHYTEPISVPSTRHPVVSMNQIRAPIPSQIYGAAPTLPTVLPPRGEIKSSTASSRRVINVIAIPACLFGN